MNLVGFLDCMDNICKYLDLQSQINMARVSPDFMHALKSFWQRSHKRVELHEVAQLADSFDKFIYYKTIKYTVKELIWWGYKDEVKLCLRRMKFPNVDKMQIELDGDLEVFGDLVLFVGICCPNLTEIHMYGNFTGKYISQLEKLERVSLIYYPETLDFQYVQNMLINVELKTFAFYEIEGFPFGRSPPEQFVNSLLRCKTLEELYLDSFFMNPQLLDRMIVSLTQLRKVAFTALERMWILENEEELEGGPLDGLSGNICGLIKGIIVTGNQISSMYEAFLTLMSRLTNLELLNFSDANIDFNFLDRLIQSRLNSNKQLNIYCHKSGVAANDLCLYPIPPNINISLSAYKHEIFEKSQIALLLKI